ncbi:MAG: thioredoxin domain-containing protein [Propionicimonas sp.]|uniref:DsbA family protein n=1 Tax=Propionicimonas sp. TaxID=1955623 RepID=UPI003D0EB844
MSSSNKSTPASSRRETLRRQQEAQARAARRTGIAIKAAWATGIAVIAVMLAVTIWAVVKPGSAGVAAGSLVPPAGATDSGAVVVGNADAKVTVTIYSDFMCPYCGEFERANGDDLTTAVDAGTVKLEIHPMSFLDAQSSGAEYSTRSANAFVTIANSDPALAWKFDRLLYANQPAEGSSGLTDAQLIAYAKQVGVADDVTSTFTRKTFVPWIQKITDKAWDDGVTGTPTVKINGETFTGDLYTAGALAAAIEQAASA